MPIRRPARRGRSRRQSRTPRRWERVGRPVVQPGGAQRRTPMARPEVADADVAPRAGKSSGVSSRAGARLSRAFVVQQAAKPVDDPPIAPFVLGLATVGISIWFWSSRPVHDYFWDAVRRGPRIPGDPHPRNARSRSPGDPTRGCDGRSSWCVLSGRWLSHFVRVTPLRWVSVSGVSRPSPMPGQRRARMVELRRRYPGIVDVVY